ncbi:LptA/OstA family protein [Phaeospirillum tilakii]|uniref:LptA/OstA family protein n=1 Tax=Phaeospirillum tilakii TaxID=741673 RepID=A0ABW5C7C5_9PROT
MTRPVLPRLAGAALAALVLAAPLSASAQGFSMAQGGAQQLQVFADQGIEWHAEELRVIASGNAKAVRGTMTLDADTLTAYYRHGANGDEIWRIDADGSVVTIRSPTDTATGTKAIYDLDQAVLVLKGGPARLVTPTDSFQASEQIEYWEGKKMAVLRGDAVATRGDRTLRADVITAHFHDKGPAAAPAKPAPAAAAGAARKASGAGEDSLDLERADAYGHVVLTTAKEVITGDRGDYVAATGIATLSGAVKMTREGGNQLEGGWAYVNMKTGISKLFPAPPNGGTPGRVQGVFTPQKRDGGAAAPSGGVPAIGDLGGQ